MWTGGALPLFFSAMSYELTGTIKKIFDRQDFPSGFYKQDFVVTTDDRYPQDIKLDCLKEKTEMLDGLKEGDRVTVHFDLRGREWNDRYYVDLAAWKIEAGDGAGEERQVARRAAPASPGGEGNGGNGGAARKKAAAKPLPPEDPGLDEFADDDVPF